MERGLSRLPTMEQRALYKLTSVEKLAEYGATLGHSASSRRHYGVSDEFEEDLRSRAFASRSARRQLSIASQVANRPESDPMMCDWEDRRRSNDEELQKLRTMVSGARLAANRGTGYYSERKYKMSGYTGFIPEIKDVIAQTPVLSQESVFEPPEFTFLNERNKPPVKNHENDCLTEEAKAAMKKGLPLGEAVNLWPNKQESPRPGTSSRPSSARPQEVHVRHGDKRIRAFRTSHAMDFQPPSRPASASSTHRALDPVTFRIIENKDKDEIGKLYASARLRVPLDLLKLILKTTRERIEAKIDVGSNCTGFKMRQLFKRYDHDQKGLVALSEFRMMLEEFGIQMSEDQITVVFSVYDKHLCGEIRYLEFMQDMLDGDYFQFYKAGVNI